jgi:hypothetical protein
MEVNFIKITNNSIIKRRRLCKIRRIKIELRCLQLSSFSIEQKNIRSVWSSRYYQWWQLNL